MKKLFSSTKIALGVAAITGGILAGAVPAKVQAAPLKRLVLAVKGEPEQGFDPLKVWGRHGGSPLFQSTLIRHDANLKLQPDLATKWTLSSDNLTWTITLREGVKFADGKPLTAEDVAYTYETGKKAASLLDLNALESARAINANTVELKLKKPRITFVQTMATLGIVPKHAYNENYARAPMGSGPFKFVSWTAGEQLIIEPNPHYYGQKPAFERITFLFTGEDASLAAAKAGQVQIAAVAHSMAGTVPANMRREVTKTVDNRGIMLPMVPSGRKTDKGIPIGNDVTSDVAIRKAINMAIDRKALVKGVIGGYGSPAWGPADGLPWDNPQQRLPDANPEGAKALLKQAGWVMGSNGVLSKNGKEARIPLLYFSDDNTRQALALAVADMLKPLGIVMEVAGKTREETHRLKHSSAVLLGWGAHSPLEVYNLIASSAAGKGFYNAGFYDNPTVSAYLEKAERSSTFQASLPHWKNAAWDGKTGFGMKGDATWAWLVNIDHVYFVNKCLDIGPRQIEPHGHGSSITWNVQDWKWTCK